MDTTTLHALPTEDIAQAALTKRPSAWIILSLPYPTNIPCIRQTNELYIPQAQSTQFNTIYEGCNTLHLLLTFEGTNQLNSHGVVTSIATDQNVTGFLFPEPYPVHYAEVQWKKWINLKFDDVYATNPRLKSLPPSVIIELKNCEGRGILKLFEKEERRQKPIFYPVSLPINSTINSSMYMYAQFSNTNANTQNDAKRDNTNCASKPKKSQTTRKSRSRSNSSQKGNHHSSNDRNKKEHQYKSNKDKREKRSRSRSRSNEKHTTDRNRAYSDHTENAKAPAKIIQKDKAIDKRFNLSDDEWNEDLLGQKISPLAKVEMPETAVKSGSECNKIICLPTGKTNKEEPQAPIKTQCECNTSKVSAYNEQKKLQQIQNIQINIIESNEAPIDATNPEKNLSHIISLKSKNNDIRTQSTEDVLSTLKKPIPSEKNKAEAKIDKKDLRVRLNELKEFKLKAEGK